MRRATPPTTAAEAPQIGGTVAFALVAHRHFGDTGLPAETGFGGRPHDFAGYQAT